MTCVGGFGRTPLGATGGQQRAPEYTHGPSTLESATPGTQQELLGSGGASAAVQNVQPGCVSSTHWNGFSPGLFKSDLKRSGLKPFQGAQTLFSHPSAHTRDVLPTGGGLSMLLSGTHRHAVNLVDTKLRTSSTVSYTHLTLPTIYTV